MGKTCWEYADGQKMYIYENILSQGGCLSLPRGYLHAYDHNIQIYFFQTAWTSQEGEMKIYINDRGHMTAMAINCKSIYLILLSQTAYDFVTWHEPSGNGALQSLLKS